MSPDTFAPLDVCTRILEVSEWQIWQAIHRDNLVFHRQGSMVLVHRESLFRSIRNANQGRYYKRN